MPHEQQLPKYHEIHIPVLEVLSQVPKLSAKDLALKVRDKYYSNLPADLINKTTKTGANVLLDRVGWSKSELRIGKFVNYPERGFV